MVSDDIKMEVVVSKVSYNKDIVWDVLTNGNCRRQIIAILLTIKSVISYKHSGFE